MADQPVAQVPQSGSSTSERFFLHWKTTAAGAAAAVLTVLLNGRSGKEVALAALMAVIGALSKDK